MRKIVFLLLLIACTPQTIHETQIVERNSTHTIIQEHTVDVGALYDQFKDSVYFVKSTCAYTYEYPEFFIRSSVHPQWGLLIDITMVQDQYLDDEKIKRKNWRTISKTNTTEYFGTAFLHQNQLYTVNHLVNCETTNEEIVASFDLMDLSGKNLSKEADIIYTDQTGFEEMRESRAVIARYINSSVAEHFRSKAFFTLDGITISSYHLNDNFRADSQAIIQNHGDDFPKKDFAILAGQYLGDGIPFANNVSIGQKIYVLGFPGGFRFDQPRNWDNVQTNPPVISAGIVGGKIISEENIPYYVIDASATFGSSGSPVLNEAGEVVGIITATDLYSDINLMLPINELPLES